MELPQEYIDKMTDLLGKEEFALYRASLDEERSFGLRINTLKISNEDFLSELGALINVKELIPWTSDGYYYDPFEKENTEKPGKLPFYHAGLYYIQEPSAMYPAQQLDVVPGDRVLDLCAAPGGKSTKLGVKLAGEGLLPRHLRGRASSRSCHAPPRPCPSCLLLLRQGPRVGNAVG